MKESNGNDWTPVGTTFRSVRLRKSSHGLTYGATAGLSVIGIALLLVGIGLAVPIFYLALAAPKGGLALTVAFGLPSLGLAGVGVWLLAIKGRQVVFFDTERRLFVVEVRDVLGRPRRRQKHAFANVRAIKIEELFQDVGDFPNVVYVLFLLMTSGEMVCLARHGVRDGIEEDAEGLSRALGVKVERKLACGPDPG